ncbi:MAG: heavy metal translocating P-type ATPase [Wenzhouxiangellaceae bacterium]|nr:heavy metal translocating P-type ATPase [Wenzhouxiangellaceae bacterium]
MSRTLAESSGTGAAEADLEACFHCGEPVPHGSALTAEIGGRPRPMCCAGCRAVATMIGASGLDSYYRFRDALPSRPDVPDAAGRFEAWDRDAVLDWHGRDAGDGRLDVTLVLENVHCAACAWLVRRFLTDHAGVADARLDIADGRLRLVFEPHRAPLSRLAAGLAGLGYPPHLDAPGADAERDRNERRRMLRYLAVAGLGMMQVMTYAIANYLGAWQGMDAATEQFFKVVSMLVAVPVALYAGQPFYRSALEALARRRAGMDLPIAAALLIALSASVLITLFGHGEVYFDSVVMFLFFLLLGRFAVLTARQRAGALGTALARALPAQARRRTAEGAESVGIVELRPGDRVLVSAGDIVPADGTVRDGRARLDEALMTGEAAPRPRAVGDAVLAGSVVASGQLEIEIAATGRETALAGIVDLLDPARRRRPGITRLADRMAGVFIGVVLVATAVAAAAWWSVDPGRVVPVMLAMLVAACPCALALGTPTALASAARGLARAGLLTVEPDALEVLPRVTRVVFDKTGTLTRREFTVDEVIASAGRASGEILAIAAALERHSTHPLAAAFRIHDTGLEASGVEVHELGVAGTVDGRNWCIGRADWVGQRLGIEAGGAGAASRIVLADRGGELHAIGVSAGMRRGADALVARLREAGIGVTLASGDHEGPVAEMAGRLGIDDVHARMRPADKLALVESLRARGEIVAVVGDGVNDAPVLAGADVSVAMADGAPLAGTQADLVCVGTSLDAVIEAFAHAPRVRSVIRQNLGWALAYNVSVLPLAALGWVPPWAAAIGMSASSLAVVLNARRLAGAERR